MSMQGLFLQAINAIVSFPCMDSEIIKFLKSSINAHGRKMTSIAPQDMSDAHHMSKGRIKSHVST